MAIAKWFPKLAPTTPLRVAARTVLEARAEGVEHYLRFVRHRPGRDPEHVHQLRVATRRLAAALSIFKSCLSRPARRRLRRAAKKLRRAAGAARDLDVQQALLKQFEVSGRVPAAVMKHSNAVLKRQRRSLDQDLKRATLRWGGRFHDSVQENLALLVEVNSTGAKFVAAARTTLRKRLNQLVAAGRRDLHDLDNLHQLRIAAKRLRYAMEVFASCFPREFQHELYVEVERVQDELGDINDLRNLTETLRRIGDTARRDGRHTDGREIAAPLAELSADIECDLNRRKAEFLRSWTAGRKKRFCERFVNLLRSPLHRVARPGHARRGFRRRLAHDRRDRKL
jgi:CHAD domain-containing protein